MRIPLPYSGGIILSYQCNLSCIHCLYNCRGNWTGWIKIEDFEKYIDLLSKIPKFHSLHLTGGEPFMNFPLLLECIKICKKKDIPFFIETNCYWAKNHEIAEEKLKKLKEAGLSSIMLSYSIFYIDKVPIENFEIAMEKSIEILGRENVTFYTFSGYKILKEKGIKGTLKFEEALEIVGRNEFLRFLGNYIVPKGKCLLTLNDFFLKFPPEKFKGQNCIFDFLNPYHIHIDLYGNYLTSFCSGITIGKFENIIKGNIKKDKILELLFTDIYQFLLWAESEGYKRKDGYINKCHICLEIRKFLFENGFKFDSLNPKNFYFFNLNY